MTKSRFGTKNSFRVLPSNQYRSQISLVGYGSHGNRLCLSFYWSMQTLSSRYHIAGKFWGRKLSRISEFCVYSQKFSPQNLGVWHPLVEQKWAICESFLPRKFPAIW